MSDTWNEIRNALLNSIATMNVAKTASELPNDSGVYMVCDGSNTPLYIGKAIDLKARWRGHALKKDVERTPGWHIRYMPLDRDAFGSLENQEGVWIGIFRPKYNKTVKFNVYPR